MKTCTKVLKVQKWETESDIPDSEFRLELPQGTSFFDMDKGVSWLTGTTPAPAEEPKDAAPAEKPQTSNLTSPADAQLPLLDRNIIESNRGGDASLAEAVAKRLRKVVNDHSVVLDPHVALFGPHETAPGLQAALDPHISAPETQDLTMQQALALLQRAGPVLCRARTTSFTSPPRKAVRFMRNTPIQFLPQTARTTFSEIVEPEDQRIRARRAPSATRCGIGQAALRRRDQH